MKISVDRATLLDAFAIASPLTKSSPKEILQYLLLTADGDGCRLLATDTEYSICLTVPGVNIKTSGSALLHVTRIGQILREASDPSLDFSVPGDKKLVVQGKTCKFNLPMPNPLEYPNPSAAKTAQAETPPPPSYTLTAATLRTLLHRTGFCTDENSTLFALGGVLLEPEENTLSAIATDGRRLGLMRGQLLTTASHDQSRPILPAKALLLIQRMLDRGFKPDDAITILIRSNDVTLSAPGATITTRQVEGRFPNWRHVVPQNRGNQPTIDLPAGPLYSAVRQAAIVSDTETHAIDLDFTAHTLTLCAAAVDVGQSRVQLPITTPADAPAIKARVDYRYLVECLRVLDPATLVHISIESHDKPIQLNTDDGYLYLIMPMTP